MQQSTESLKPGVYTLDSGGEFILFENNTFAILAVHSFICGRWENSGKEEITFKPLNEYPFAIYGRKSESNSEGFVIKMIHNDPDDNMKVLLSNSYTPNSNPYFKRIETDNGGCQGHYKRQFEKAPTIHLALQNHANQIMEYKAEIPQEIDELILVLNHFEYSGENLRTFTANLMEGSWILEGGSKLNFKEKINTDNDDIRGIQELIERIDNKEYKYYNRDCLSTTTSILKSYFKEDVNTNDYFLDPDLDFEDLFYSEVYNPDSEQLLLLLNNTNNPVFNRYRLMTMKSNGPVDQKLISQDIIIFECME